MATSTGTQQPSGPGPFPPFMPETFASQFVWLALFFVLLYVLMAKIALPRVGGILKARADRIAFDLAEAQRHKAESEAAMAAYEKALADARGRAQVIANETRERLVAESEERRKALESELASKLVDAEKSIAATKASAMTNVRSVAVDAAGTIVEHLTGAAPAGGAVEQAVERVLKR